ncbi:hypothetical protein CWR48_10260 [Oceanobacillus arenosus]|uniref:Lipoprotein n=1 Tax=Oceanobacillus arenosus TaxID=1229153 RepID=A0A3D8PTV5_9BACI|nr:hypothetical protein [Oceanobacillus arenosus]RDW18698.1 hypothetical protein CWR48_10260 [Oceanobacillus arenosus]
MKMKVFSILTFFIIFMFFLTACSNNSEGTNVTDEQITTVEEAIVRTSELDNGRYIVLYGQGDKSDEKALFEEGTFVAQNNQLDWQMKYLNGAEIEVMQKDGVQYQLFPGESEWQKVEGQAFSSNITSLMDLELSMEDIESVNVTKEDGVTTYEFTFNDNYLKSLANELVSDSKEQLTTAKEQNNEQMIDYWEMTLEYHESFKYIDSKVSLFINDAGVVVKYLNDGTLDSMNMSSNKIETTSSKVEIEITDYNTGDIAIEL